MESESLGQFRNYRRMASILLSAYRPNPTGSPKIDNFSPHYSAIKIATPPPHIRISWLSANSTSLFEPLDRGIIQSFKAYYRRKLLSCILGCFNTNRSSMETVNLRLIIRWTIWSWNQDL